MRATLKRFLVPLLLFMLVASVMIAASTGDLYIAPRQIVEIMLVKTGLTSSGDFTHGQEAVFWTIRLPRVIASGLVGSALALAGACMQGLFRNPLADPGLIGTSAGAALSAAVVIVLGLNLSMLGQLSLALITFIGAAATTLLVYSISQFKGKTVVATMLLAGIAINALAASGTGFLTFISDEAELRTLTFWLLGSLGGATWEGVAALLPFVVVPMLIGLRLAKDLNALSLGENDAGYAGINVSTLKLLVILAATMAVGASVAISGIIGFIGLVVPHTVRLLIGPDHRQLIPASMLLGATTLILSDLLCRTLLPLTELPIGIVTALLGTPLFLSILLKEKRRYSLAA